MNIGAILDHLRSDGLRGFAYDIEALAHRATDRRTMRHGASKNGQLSSISDSGEYPRFCQLASADDRVFSRFRRSLIYMQILEAVWRDEGLAYLAEIRRSGDMLDRLRPLLSRIEVGGPRVYSFPGIGFASPTTLRYIKVASDLERFFGSLDDLKVAEIGVGYGGQCRAVSAAWKLQSYALYDLPEVLALSHRFLDVSGVDLSHIVENDGRNPVAADADLVVSNYAFSELRREVQQDYLDRVVLSAPRGYLTYNHISPPELRSFTADEITAMIPGARLLDEVPKTSDKNVIIVWGASEA